MGMLNTDLEKLADAMWSNDRRWRDLDQQIRQMNKRLAVWRRANKEVLTYRHTQRVAVELLVTMDVIYGLAEKPQTLTPTADPQPVREQPRAVGEEDGVWSECDGTIGAAMIWWGEQIVATSDGPAETRLDVLRAA